VHDLRRPEGRASARILERTSAQGDDSRGLAEHLRHDLSFEGSERRLSAAGEDGVDRRSGSLFYRRVGVDERHAEPLGEQQPNRRLAGPHEADEDNHRSRRRAMRAQ
jgi:hypothetical protein